MIVALYARVSTDKQSCDMQLDALREYAARREFEIIEEYVDTGISGTKSSRPALNRLMADAKKRKFAAVLVWKFDRFARSVKHLLASLDEFNHFGIAFISYSESLDTSSPMGRAVYAILGAISELERNLIAERVRSGVKRAMAKRETWGRKAIKIDNLHPGLSVRKAAELAGVSRETIRRRRAEIVTQ